MFDMKMTTLMRLILFLLVYFMFTNLFIATEGKDVLTETTMSLDVPELEPEEMVEEGIEFRELLKPEAYELIEKELIEEPSGWRLITSSIKNTIKYIADLFTQLFRLITFDIPFPEFMKGTFLVYTIRTTIGTTISIILLIVIIQLITLIKNMISPFAG